MNKNNQFINISKITILTFWNLQLNSWLIISLFIRNFIGYQPPKELVESKRSGNKTILGKCESYFQWEIGSETLIYL